MRRYEFELHERLAKLHARAADLWAARARAFAALPDPRARDDIAEIDQELVEIEGAMRSYYRELRAKWRDR